MKHPKAELTYIGHSGIFHMENPEQISDLVFPLCNAAGMMSSITPSLHGDIKTDQHHFVTAPITVEDMHNTRSARNFWVHVAGKGAFSVTGSSSEQRARKFGDEPDMHKTVEAGLLWHKLQTFEPMYGIKSEILSFIPADDTVELMQIKVTNCSDDAVSLTPTAAIPIFARSAENLRDHRHVTSLVNRVKIRPEGVVVKPEIVFDEKGHRFNEVCYYVLGREASGQLPIGFFPELHDFIGACGTLEWPEAVVTNRLPNDADSDKDSRIRQGVEYVGALRFADVTLQPGDSSSWIVLVGIAKSQSEPAEVFARYQDDVLFQQAFDDTCAHWKELSERVAFSGHARFAEWMRWVGIQPVLRKIYGNSFMPYHDYGKGGRGWRDLWQDCLSLILYNATEARPLLVDNFGGVRLDGTNATIIGSQPGEFIADRNNIARVWMDHGAWPWLTTRLYIDQTGDAEILMAEQSYFHDGLSMRAKRRDPIDVQLGTRRFSGSILEHLLVQHLTAFFHVGDHNIMLLEGADWNDTLDMARERGESTAFTALYGSNLLDIAALLDSIADKNGMTSIPVFEELTVLLDTMTQPANYDRITEKRDLLSRYMESVSSGISGKKVSASVSSLTKDLRGKGEWIMHHLRRQEWLQTQDGMGFFNGYYNNDGERVDGDDVDGVHMNLTAQVFTTMFGLADENQRTSAFSATRRYLHDPKTGGTRLNTPLGKHQLNFGRGFAFAYGEKENGATFCHMVVMYINALYRQHMVKEAYLIFSEVYGMAQNTDRSGIYPGIPEYFNAEGKGLYPYLTGSASWLLLTVLTEMFGVRGDMGDLVIEPKLMAEQFESGMLVCTSNIHHLRVRLEIANPLQLDYGAYHIAVTQIDPIPKEACQLSGALLRIPRSVLNACIGGNLHLQVELVPVELPR